jgi:hypothetical protein
MGVVAVRPSRFTCTQSASVSSEYVGGRVAGSKISSGGFEEEKNQFIHPSNHIQNIPKVALPEKRNMPKLIYFRIFCYNSSSKCLLFCSHIKFCPRPSQILPVIVCRFSTSVGFFFFWQKQYFLLCHI